MAFAEWLRVNSQRYLLEASEREMAEKYLGGAPPVMGGGPQVLFWRKVFVPVYRLVPWSWRRWMMQMMPPCFFRQDFCGHDYIARSACQDSTTPPNSGG